MFNDKKMMDILIKQKKNETIWHRDLSTELEFICMVQSIFNLFPIKSELCCLLEKVIVVYSRKMCWYVTKDIIEHFLDIRKIIVSRLLVQYNSLARCLVVFINVITYWTLSFLHYHVILIYILLFMHRFYTTIAY